MSLCELSKLPLLKLGLMYFKIQPKGCLEHLLFHLLHWLPVAIVVKDHLVQTHFQETDNFIFSSAKLLSYLRDSVKSTSPKLSLP